MYKDLLEITKTIWDELFPDKCHSRGKMNKAKFNHLRVIIIDLIKAHREDPTKYLGISLIHDSFICTHRDRDILDSEMDKAIRDVVKEQFGITLSDVKAKKLYAHGSTYREPTDEDYEETFTHEIKPTKFLSWDDTFTERKDINRRHAEWETNKTQPIITHNSQYNIIPPPYPPPYYRRGIYHY